MRLTRHSKGKGKTRSQTRGGAGAPGHLISLPLSGLSTNILRAKFVPMCKKRSSAKPQPMLTMVATTEHVPVAACSAMEATLAACSAAAAAAEGSPSLSDASPALVPPAGGEGRGRRERKPVDYMSERVSCEMERAQSRKQVCVPRDAELTPPAEPEAEPMSLAEPEAASAPVAASAVDIRTHEKERGEELNRHGYVRMAMRLQGGSLPHQPEVNLSDLPSPEAGNILVLASPGGAGGDDEASSDGSSSQSDGSPGLGPASASAPTQCEKKLRSQRFSALTPCRDPFGDLAASVDLDGPLSPAKPVFSAVSLFEFPTTQLGGLPFEFPKLPATPTPKQLARLGALKSVLSLEPTTRRLGPKFSVRVMPYRLSGGPLLDMVNFALTQPEQVVREPSEERRPSTVVAIASEPAVARSELEDSREVCASTSASAATATAATTATTATTAIIVVGIGARDDGVEVARKLVGGGNVAVVDPVEQRRELHRLLHAALLERRHVGSARLGAWVERARPLAEAAVGAQLHADIAQRHPQLPPQGALLLPGGAQLALARARLGRRRRLLQLRRRGGRRRRHRRAARDVGEEELDEGGAARLRRWRHLVVVEREEAAELRLKRGRQRRERRLARAEDEEGQRGGSVGDESAQRRVQRRLGVAEESVDGREQHNRRQRLARLGKDVRARFGGGAARAVSGERGGVDGVELAALECVHGGEAKRCLAVVCRAMHEQVRPAHGGVGGASEVGAQRRRAAAVRPSCSGRGGGRG